MNVPKTEELDSPKKKGSLYIKKHYPEFHQYILDTYPNINKFNAGIYLYFNKLEHPKCIECGKPTQFLDETRGFQKFCCRKCANSNSETRNKIKDTNIKKYGGVAPACSEQIKEKMISTSTKLHGGQGNASASTKNKQKNTMKELYGVEHALQNEDIKSKAIKNNISNNGGIGFASDKGDKIRDVIKENYGGLGLGSDIIKQRIYQRNEVLYGDKIPSKNPSISSKISKTKSKTFVETHKDILNIETIGKSILYTCSCPHQDCKLCEEKTYQILASRYCDRRLAGTEPCTKLLPIIKDRNSGTTIEVFVRQVLQELSDSLTYNDRTIITPYELDIVDRVKGLAFECNGVYWHSKKGPSYHINKFKQCQEHGIQLITIWEDWIRNKPEIVKSIIRAKYHTFDRVLYGRKCKIKQMSSKDAFKFLNKNHIQGESKATYYYGLMYEDELVSLMTFSKMRGCMGSNKSRDDNWELVRFCTKLNTQVIGAADKLIKYFIQQHNPKSITSFSSNDISDGSLYKRLGFVKCSENTSYWYIGQQYKRYHRSNFTKNAITKMGFAPNKEKWTEYEAMTEAGFYRIYDSGQTKWVLNIK